MKKVFLRLFLTSQIKYITTKGKSLESKFSKTLNKLKCQKRKKIQNNLLPPNL